MRWLGISLFALAFFTAAAFDRRMANEDRIRLIEAETARAHAWSQVEQPLCEFYFEWSAKMNDRVAGFEKHCARSLEARHD